jgi:hypothetical protein
MRPAWTALPKAYDSAIQANCRILLEDGLDWSPPRELGNLLGALLARRAPIRKSFIAVGVNSGWVRLEEYDQTAAGGWRGGE